MARHDPYRNPNRTSIERELSGIGDDLPVLSANESDTTSEPELFGRRRTDESRVIPCEARNRLGQLLQPGIVCKPAVKYGRVRLELYFKSIGARGSRA